MKLSKGFTLIEVAIATCMLAVMIASVYPTYKQHVRTTERQEAMRTIDGFAKQAREYYEDNATYSEFSPSIKAPVPGYSFSTVTTPHSFLITAIPLNDQLHDRCGELSVNQLGQHHASKAPPAHSNERCW